jgi:hypothetical protein
MPIHIGTLASQRRRTSVILAAVFDGNASPKILRRRVADGFAQEVAFAQKVGRGVS